MKYLKLFEEFKDKPDYPKYGYIKSKLEELREIVASTNFSDDTNNFMFNYEISKEGAEITLRVNDDTTRWQIDVENTMMNTISPDGNETEPQHMNDLDEMFHEVETDVYNAIGVSEKMINEMFSKLFNPITKRIMKHLERTNAEIKDVTNEYPEYKQGMESYIGKAYRFTIEPMGQSLKDIEEIDGWKNTNSGGSVTIEIRRTEYNYDMVYHGNVEHETEYSLFINKKGIDGLSNRSKQKLYDFVESRVKNNAQ